MSNPFLFNSFGGAPPQQQNYPNNQQNQGWNQNTTPSTQSNFQSPQMDFFDITTPQFNQTPPNNNANGPKDFRSLMNSTSNDTTSQFSQPFQPPQDLNQLRSIFTRDDDPIIVPVTPQTNQQQQQPYSTSTYSPSFTFIPENMNQNQSTFTQPEKQQQTGQMTVDFSKYDPLAGEIGKTNVSKQPASNENNQVTSQIPDVDNVPMVFYGADTTSTNAPTDFGGGFPSFQSNPSAGNANQGQTQPQNNFFNIQQPNQSANNFSPQNQQQQQNSNFFNMQAAPQQSQAQNIFNNEQTPQQQAPQQAQQQAAPIQQNADFFTIQPDQQSTPITTTFSGAQNQQQTAPIQQNADFFTIQPDQQTTPSTATTAFSGAQNQQQAQQTAPVQQNADFFTFHPDQQSAPATTTTTFSGAQNQQQASADIFTMPNTQQTNENPFLMPQKPQSNSTDISLPFQMIENSIPSPIYANGSISHSNPSLSVFDMFRVDNNQQQQQNSHLVTNIPAAENQQNPSMDHIFGDATQQQQQNSNPVTNLPVTENQQNSSMDHIFGDMNQSNQQQPQQSQQQNSNPITNLPAADNQQNSSMDHIFGDMNQSAQQQQQQQQQPDIFDPFGRHKNASQQEQQKPAVSSDNPFVIDNGFKIEINAPKSEPIFATVDDAYNPFGESTNDKENPFAISNNAEKENVYQAPSFLATSNTDNQPQNVNDSPSKLPEPSQNEQNDNPFVGITTTDTNPFISDQAKSQEKQVNPTIPPPPSASNDIQEPFDPFGRNASSTETKKEPDNKSSIDYMRNLFASNSNDLFTKPADQAKTTTTPEQNQQPISTATESTTTDQKSDVTTATENAQQNTSPAFDPFGVGSSVPMMEGASFTFNIDEQEETTKANEDQNAHKSETSANEKSSSTTAPSNNNNSPIFTFDIPQQQQQQTQQPQIVDDLFFDFSSIPPPKSDNNNTKAIDDFNITAPSQPAASPEVDENIRPGTDESSMSLSDDDEGENVKQLPANSEQKQSNQSETKKEASQISLNESKSGSGIGFYSDGVNSFTFDANKERLSGPNPFEIGKQNQDANPFVTNSEQSKASTIAASTTESAQKFNPFAIPPPPSSSTSKNAPSTDVFKEEPAAKTSTSDASFNPFGQQPQKPKTVQEQPDPFAKPQQSAATEKPKEEQSNNSVFSPFGQPPQKPKTQDIPDPFAPPPVSSSPSNEKPKEEASSNNSASFNPFGQQPQKPKTVQEQQDPFAKPQQSAATEKPKEEQSNNSVFSPFGQPPQKPKTQDIPDPFAQPSSSNESQAADQSNDVPFNPFGQVFPTKENESNAESSFTFKLRSNQTPEIDENDFLPVGQQETQTKSEAEPSSSQKAEAQQQQSFSPFGTVNQNQNQQPLGFGTMNTAQQQSNGEENNNAVTKPRKSDDSSQNLSFVKRARTSSASDPFTLLINSLTPYTEIVESESDDDDEVNANGQIQSHHHHHHNHEEDSDENESENPFTHWKPTELDSALGKCDEPEELNEETLNKFRGKIPPPPTFVAFEQSPAANILKEYCSQLSNTGSSLEHINELLGIQDMARISIEEFSA